MLLALVVPLIAAKYGEQHTGVDGGGVVEELGRFIAKRLSRCGSQHLCTRTIYVKDERRFWER
jgi:hypothetical protein